MPNIVLLAKKMEQLELQLDDAELTEEEIEALTKYIEETYENAEVDTINGGQNVYSYILAIE